MTQDQECKFALIEFGDAEKTGYWFLKGGDKICKNPTLAHTYWYPDDITQEEVECEINDLAEHYKNVAVLVPLPEHLHFHVLKPVDRPESEAAAWTE